MSSASQTPTSDTKQPRSPGRFSSSRLQEKEELQNLNDRFAIYIERVQQLEELNQQLTYDASFSREQVDKEVNNVKSLYDAELQEARKLLDELAKDKSRLVLENGRQASNIDDIRTKYDVEVAAHKKTTDEVRRLERQLRDKEAHLSEVVTDKRHLDARVSQLEKELADSKDALRSAQLALESSSLQCADVENQLISAREDMAFIKNLNDQELNDLKDRLASAESQKCVMETDFKAKYDGLLHSKLQELREEFELEALDAKKEMEGNYNNKLNLVRSQLEKDSGAYTELDRNYHSVRSQLDALRIEKMTFDSKLAAYDKKLESLGRMREEDRADFLRTLTAKEDTINELTTKLNQFMTDYDELMGIKLALDLEIAAYRKLLEGEEERLNISAKSSPSTPRTKRSRLEGSELAEPVYEGPQVIESDPAGKYLKLKNYSNEDSPLGGWTLRKIVDKSDPVEYKFGSRFNLKSGAVVTVWSAASGVQHKPPADLVMKQHDTWGSGSDETTTLLNAAGEVVSQLSNSGSDVVDSPSRGFTLPPRRAVRTSRVKQPVEGKESCTIS